MQGSPARHVAGPPGQAALAIAALLCPLPAAFVHPRQSAPCARSPPCRRGPAPGVQVHPHRQAAAGAGHAWAAGRQRHKLLQAHTGECGAAGAVDAISRADAECRLRLCIHCRRVDSWVPQRRLDGTRARRCRRFSPHRRCLPRATAASSCQTATATAGWRSLMQMAPGCKTTACRRRPRYPSLLPTGGTRVKWVGGRGRNGWNSQALCVIFLPFRSLPAFLAAPHMASPSAALRDACVSPAYSAH